MTGTVAIIKRKGIPQKKYVSRPSQITRETPSKRLRKRRALSPKEGYFPNPSVTQSKISSVTRSLFGWIGKLEAYPKTSDLRRQSIISYAEGVTETMKTLGLYDKHLHDSIMARLAALTK